MINRIIKILKFIKPYIISVTATIAFVLLINYFVLTQVKVSGISMNPTFNDGDNLIMYKLTINPKLNDIVVCKDSDINSGYIIKRCIGISGDTVIIDYNTDNVFVNNELIEEKYIAEKDMDTLDDSNGVEIDRNVFKYEVPENCIFVLGDNRNNSMDSRFDKIGYIPIESVVGTIFFNVSDFEWI